MRNDPIIEELHKIREEHAAEFDFDLNKIYQDLKSKEKSMKFKILDLPTINHADRMVIAEDSTEYH
ncbi:MAG: hypothetical protein HW421_191 [Ignavibacteria bacterium]|nr:hypothetical protein [Ignavibacteria bacterium]